MKTIRRALALGFATVGLAAFAHAAPVQNDKPQMQRMPANPPQLSVLRVEASVLPVPNKCGQPTTARVLLKNKTLKAWNGTINFVAGGTVNTPVALAASGEDATKTINVTGPVLDCKKPLGVQGIRVWVDPSSPILVAPLQPKAFSGRRDFFNGGVQPGPQPLQVRSVLVNGTCGDKATGQVIMYSPPNLTTAADASVKLTFGTATQTTSIKVPGAASLAATLDVPAPFNCNAPGGFPTLGYEVSAQVPNANGKLEVSEVTFEPNP